MIDRWRTCSVDSLSLQSLTFRPPYVSVRIFAPIRYIYLADEGTDRLCGLVSFGPKDANINKSGKRETRNENKSLGEARRLIENAKNISYLYISVYIDTIIKSMKAKRAKVERCSLPLRSRWKKAQLALFFYTISFVLFCFVLTNTRCSFYT